jgi:hypothetical protein
MVYAQYYLISEHGTLSYIQNTECLGPPSSTEVKEFIGTSTVLHAFKTWRLMKQTDNIIHILHKVSDTGPVHILRNDGRDTPIQSYDNKKSSTTRPKLEYAYFRPFT